jgi:hypothetical protein
MSITLSQQLDIICKKLGVEPQPVGDYVEPLRCAECHEASDAVKYDGDICADCAEDFGRGYKIRQMAGRCANGAERDHGARWHAINAYTGKALCGATPGRRSAGWSMYRGESVTCPRCLAVIESADRRAKLAAEQYQTWKQVTK